MTQPHPPIPEPQPHGGSERTDGVEPTAAGSTAVGSAGAPSPDDDPRTQSILLPPSQRQVSEHPVSEHQDELGGPALDLPAPGQVTPEPVSREQVTEQVPPQPAFAPYDPAAPTRATGPMDFVPGFGSEQPRAGAGAVPPPPVPGPVSTPGYAPGPTGSSPSAVPSPRPDAGPVTAPTTAWGHAAPADPSTGGTGTPPSGRSPLAPVGAAAREGSVLVGLVLGVLGLALLEIGLALDFGNQSLWEVVPTWSAFATVAAVVALVPLAVRLAGRGLPARTAWRAGAAGVGALAVFWVLVALPLVGSDRGFWLTAALGAAAAALWLAPGREE